MRNYEVVDADRSLNVEDVHVWLTEPRPSRIVRKSVFLSLVVGIAGLVVAVTFRIHYDVARSARTGELKVLESRISQLKAEQAAHHDDLEALQRSIGKAGAVAASIPAAAGVVAMRASVDGGKFP